MMRAALSIAAAALLAWGGLLSAADTEAFRFGVSSASMGMQNRNDMTAALKAWSKAVIQDLRLEVSIHVVPYDNTSQLIASLREGTVESATMTAEEFVRSDARPKELFLAARDEGYAVNYLLLVRATSPHRDLTSLAGKELATHESPTTSLALPWLDVSLLRAGLPRSERAFARLNRLENPSKCVLRVFFGQSDACLVTSQTFRVACELNPQLTKALRPLDTSPAVIPVMFFVRPDHKGPFRERIEDALVDLHRSVAGRQLLTVYMATRMERHPIAVFDATRRLVEEYLRSPDPSLPGSSMPKS